MATIPAAIRAAAIEGFEAAWGERPSHVVRAPGRVNLIGEHIDYCGLPVLPSALERAVWLAFRETGDGRVRIATSEAGLAAAVFEADWPVAPGPEGDWANYVRAAIEALGPPPSAGPAEAGRSTGLAAFVVADLPVAAGLSSSSALVVASALAWMACRGVEVGRDASTRLDLAERLARGERYVGTAGGGMDQAVCLLGREGHALRIEFDPLRATPVPIPAGWALVVAHSGERAEKSGAAREIYNQRTRESAEAARSVRLHLGMDPEGGYPSLLGTADADELVEAAAALDPVLRARFRHVASEARRVAEAERALRRGDLGSFGGLLSASHRSLRDDYAVSTPRLDRLVAAATAAGAAGARLTGAGLGGSIVAVCTADRAEGVLEAVRSDLGPPADGAPPSFLAIPSAGAEVIRL